MNDIIGNINGPLFRNQRLLLMKIADLARKKQPYEPASGDEDLLEGLINLTDDIADQATRRARHRLPAGRRRGRRVVETSLAV